MEPQVVVFRGKNKVLPEPQPNTNEVKLAPVKTHKT